VEREGHRVIQAADGRRALEVLRSEPVDMVLLDLLMPDIDGFEVLEALRADPDLHDIPVLVVSAVEATDEVVRAIGLGAIDCLPKPVEPALLHVRLRTALERTRLRRLEKAYLRQELALRQQERLATLGRLSAGLGHELNNPAAAALSTSRQLRDEVERAGELVQRLAESDGGAEVARVVGELLSTPRPSDAAPGSGVAHLADLEAALTAAGVPEPWTTADDLAAAGLSTADVERVLTAGRDGALAVEWLRVRAAISHGLDGIGASVARMAELTSALRGYSFLDRAPQQDVDVVVGLDDTLTILEHRVPAGVEVVRDYRDPPSIHAYGGQLNQVWTNLVDNALDALASGGTLTVSAVAADGGVLVEVRDDGPGVPPDLVGRVFDPFVTTKPPGEGTGLGLNVAHHIVTDVHGGRMAVRSVPGETVFSVWLPLVARPSHEPDDR
jgi:signal transduction histidine kinase